MSQDLWVWACPKIVGRVSDWLENKLNTTRFLSTSTLSHSCKEVIISVDGIGKGQKPGWKISCNMKSTTMFTN